MTAPQFLLWFVPIRPLNGRKECTGPNGFKFTALNKVLELDFIILTCFCQFMSKTERLLSITTRLQDGRTHRAEGLAAWLNVTPRTIYRDMAHLQATGVPVSGTQGQGYHLTAAVTLPPLNLTGDELEVLRLGLGVIADAGESGQQQAAHAMLAKLDQALGDDLANSALSPTRADPHQQRHLTQIRLAISARQKLRVTIGRHHTTIRPLRLDFFGRIWRCVCWDEALGDFDAPPVSEISFLAILPGLFVDETGKTLKDYLLS